MGLVVLREQHTLHLEQTPGEVLHKLRAHMRRSNPAGLKVRLGQGAGRFVLRFPSYESQLGTPQLEIDLKGAGEGRCLMTVTLGPSPLGVRLLRAAAFLAGMIALAGMSWAFLQWNNGGMAWGAYMLMAGLSTWLFLYFIAENGKRRNRDRIDLLKTFVEGALQVPLDKQPARSGAEPIPATYA